jgi:serine/threonine protein kinase
MNHKSESLINQIFFEKYKVIRKIGQGSFGRIYICQDIISNEFYAMKVEQISTLNRVLEIESKYLNYLKGFGIPELIFFGRSEKYFILIETLLGKSLENLYSESHGNFNIKDVCMIGIQILDRLEYIHNKNIIHRDIKPDNFVIGKNEDKNTIFMIDFGLAKRYRNPLTQEHIPFRLTKRLTGTARYASVNALKGGEQSRKDDLESLNYMLLYFLRGSLPWQGVAGLTKGEKYKKIYHIKKNIGAEKLYENLPNEFKEVYLYIKKLEFEQDPDYDYCRKLFVDVIENRIGGIYDNYFTWCEEINSAKKNHIFNDMNINKSSNNNDESGKTVKSTKIINICNSNILLDKTNNKKIKKISITFVDNRNKNKNKIKNCAYNFNQDIKKNK